MEAENQHDETIRIIDASELEQGSLGWHEMRSQHYPASEAGAAMGVSPWTPKNQRELHAVRSGDMFVAENEAMRRGARLEEPARQEMARLLDIDLEPAIAVRGQYMASLDGFGFSLDGSTTVAEIKVPMNPEKLAAAIGAGIDEIPKHYFWQIVQQAYCSGADFLSFSAHAFDGDQVTDTWFILLEGDHLRAHWPELRAAWEKFASTNHEPVEVRRDDEAWKEAARAYTEAKEAVRRARAEAGLAALERAEKAAKERLLELAEPEGMIRTTGYGVSVLPYESKAYAVEASVRRRVSGAFEEPDA
jgi:putative phage-type endonuclease